jgi:putative membrane protein
VFELGLLLSIVASACAGMCVGFGAGLVPGLHMNNIAAGLTAYAGVALAFFGVLGGLFHSNASGLLVCCFISSALVAHLFAESITSTYLGIPAGDVVSVLPAHRLARAGLGRIAVRSSADGTLGGIVLSTLALLPLCLFMGHPLHFYSVLKNIMGYIMVMFSAILLLSEGPSRPRVAKATALFLTSGLLGLAVLMSDFYASAVPDMPWMNERFVPRSSLLLPLFAGLFGVPSLLNSIGSRQVFDLRHDMQAPGPHTPRPRDYALSLLGGTIVGWLPGMTSGSSATLCAPRVKEVAGEDEVGGSVRFIWLYSFISASGSVFAVGALFVILRARSGSMDAVQFFMGDALVADDLRGDLLPLASVLLSMLIAACIARWALSAIDSRLSSLHRLLCSKKVAELSLLFVASLSVALTGARGMMVMSAAVCLGLLPPLVGVRRIQLMGCLLVPITIGFFTS